MGASPLGRPPRFLRYMVLAENTAGPWFNLSVFFKLGLKNAGSWAARKHRKVLCQIFHPLPRAAKKPWQALSENDVPAPNFAPNFASILSPACIEIYTTAVLDASKLGPCAARPSLFACAFLGVFRSSYASMMSEAPLSARAPFASSRIAILEYNQLFEIKDRRKVTSRYCSWCELQQTMGPEEWVCKVIKSRRSWPIKHQKGIASSFKTYRKMSLGIWLPSSKRLERKGR